MKNTLYYGDNLDILRRYIKDESVDLIYLDPPFKSNQNYNVLFKERNGTQSSAQIKAFEDTWHWDRKAEDTYIEIVEKLPKKIADLVKALRSFLGENDMMAYLVMMAIRLQELHRVLKPTGSIYLHCDPTASHYLKLLMDAVFGAKGFRSEIVWRRSAAHSDSSGFGRLHDVVFFYSKSDDFFFQTQYQPYSEKYIAIHYRHQDTKGLFLDDNLTAKGLRGGGYSYNWKGKSGIWRCPIDTMKKHETEGRLYYTSKGNPRYKRYLHEMPGVPAQDIWTDIPPINSQAKERLGYPTQKPEKLLERIIRASSKEGNIVLDPFCGCGTAITMAERLKRKWIGIDITHLAISLMKHRLADSFGGQIEYQVIGEPVDLKSAEELANQDRYQFQWWALGLIGARPAKSEQKKGPDEGIDGYIYFHDDPKKKETKEVIIQVKSGHVGSGMIDALKGVVEKKDAQIGVFITLEEPTKPMMVGAVSSGYYKSPLGHNYPKIQILTIRELLEGKKIDYPSRTRGIDATFRKAERHKEESKQKEIEF